MPPDRSFRRNFFVIAMLHVAAVIGIYLFSLSHGKPPADQVMWLDGGSVGGGNTGDDAAPMAVKTSQTETMPEPPPEREPPPPPPPPPEEKTAPSELVTPGSTPQPNTPKPEATPRPETPRPSTPRPTPKATPHHTPKPKPVTPKPKPKPKATPSEDQGEDATPKPKASPDAKLKDTFTEAKNGGDHSSAAGTADSPGSTPGKSGGNGAGTGNGKGSGKAGGGSGTSQFGWYFSMIHDRFHSRWDQPTSIDHTGQDIVTTLKIKIAKDGTILSREIVKSSGETVMDQSVMTAAERVQQIDPLPTGLGNGDTYEVNIAFKLEQNQ